MATEFGTSSGDDVIEYGIKQNGFLELAQTGQIFYKDSQGRVQNTKLEKPENLTDDQWAHMTTRSKRTSLIKGLAHSLKWQKPRADIIRAIQDKYGAVQDTDEIFG